MPSKRSSVARKRTPRPEQPTGADPAVRDSQALFRGIFDNAPVGIYWSTPDGTLLIANNELARILGYDSPKDLLDVNLERDVYLRPAERRRLVARYTDVADPQTVEVEWKRKDGSPIWVQLRARTVREGRGRALYFESFVLDVTRRKRAEEDLRASQDRFEKAFHSSPAAVLIVRESDGLVIDVNDAWSGLYGWMKEEAVGRTTVQLGLQDPVERKARIAEIRRNGRVRSGDVRVRSRSGEMRDILYSAEPLELGGEHCFLALSIDLTDRKRVEQELRESQERLRLVGRATMKDVIWDWDVVSDIVWWGGAVEAAFGYGAGDLGTTSEGWRSRLHPDDAERVTQRLKTVMQNDMESWSDEYRFRRADGSYAVVLDRCYIVRDPSGKAVRMVGSLMDLTEARRSEGELRALAARLQSVREDERKRLSRELHDELGQVLTALKIDLSHLRRALPEEETGAHERVNAMKGLLDRATAEAHRMAMELRPTILDDLGLVSAVRWLVDDFSRRAGVPCEFEASDIREPLPDELATTVFRIVQESLTNIARHAEASRVEVWLHQDLGGIVVRVSDDGIGVAPELPNREHLGLLGLRERATHLGGEVTVRSQRREGTAVTARIPLPAS